VLVLINELTLHQAWLVLEMLTIWQQVLKQSWYVTSHPGQLSLAIPQWVGAMSSSFLAMG